MTAFPIPDAALARHIACVGETGSGKTHDTKAIVEHVVADGYRVCVLDTIKSDWWGITSSASGKRPGLPFKILGGPRGHVPLHSGAGKAIGQLVGEGKLPLSIIDMADFEPGGPQRFFEHFAQALWKHVRGVIYLVIEEAHELAPKERAGFGAENMAIHWAKKLATGSRTKGIRLIIASQRTQAVHNALLGSCGTLMAHILSLPADQKPIIDWLNANVRDKTLRVTIEDDLAFLQTGTAWVCCAKSEFFKKVHFPKIATFDNTATPDKDADDFDVATAPVDPDELRAIIGDAVKEAEANDPLVLRKKLVGMADPTRVTAWWRDPQRKPANQAFTAGPERQMAYLIEEAMSRSRPSNDGTKSDIGPLLDAQHAQGFAMGWRAASEAHAETLKAHYVTANAAARGIAEASELMRRATLPEKIPARKPITGIQMAKVIAGPAVNALAAAVGPKREFHAPVAQRQTPRHSRPMGNGAGSTPAGGTITEGLSRPQQRILDALAWMESFGIERADRPRAAILAGASHRSSGFEKNISTLKTRGLISYPAAREIALTDDGRAAANKPDRLATTDDLHAAIRAHVSAPQWRILEALCSAYPNTLTRDELAERAEASAASSGFEKNVSTLKSFGFVEYPANGCVAATAVMFVGAP